MSRQSQLDARRPRAGTRLDGPRNVDGFMLTTVE
jgi:hypothetical protein